jgi:hypothetical protein
MRSEKIIRFEEQPVDQLKRAERVISASNRVAHGQADFVSCSLQKGASGIGSGLGEVRHAQRFSVAVSGALGHNDSLLCERSVRPSLPSMGPVPQPCGSLRCGNAPCITRWGPDV